MAISKVGICNMALVRLGAAPITSLNEDNDAAVACSSHYDAVRDAVLEDFPWHFAKRRAALNKLASTPPFGYAAEFQKPADALRLLESDNDDFPWVEEDGKIRTNRSAISFLYIYQVTDESKFSPTFVDMFAERLASEIAFAVTGKTTETQLHFEIYNKKLQAAKTVSSQTGTPPDLESDTLINVRGGGTTEPPLAK